jgi:hypothetical protein
MSWLTLEIYMVLTWGRRMKSTGLWHPWRKASPISLCLLVLWVFYFGGMWLSQQFQSRPSIHFSTSWWVVSFFLFLFGVFGLVIISFMDWSQRDLLFLVPFFCSFSNCACFLSPPQTRFSDTSGQPYDCMDCNLVPWFEQDDVLQIVCMWKLWCDAREGMFANY